jgi:hypothetical protein
VTGAPRFWLLDACSGEKFAGLPMAAVEGAEALVALTGALIEFERPEDGAHQVFIDVLHAHERRARLTLRFDIVGGALERLSLGAQTAFVARGEFCR